MDGLNTLQLTWALRKYAQTDSQFVGVFARDELPLIIDQIPAIIIANTDPSTKSGSHWILFYFDNNGNVEYFDSLGKTLTHYHKDFLKFIKNNCNYYSCKVLLLLWLAIWWRLCFVVLSVLNFWGMFVRVYPKIVQGLTFLNSAKHITIILARCTS